MPNVSVIIPAYNASATISDCLKSIVAQKTGHSYEIIVVDDGSSDSTAEIVRTFRKVRLIRQQNKGPAVARNKGARSAKGKILVFTDADCVADKNWLEGMLKPFSDSEIAGAQGCYKTRQKSLAAKFSQIEIEHRYARMKRTKFIDFIGSYSAAYRKGIFLKFGGFDESFPTASGEDPELSYRLAKAGQKMVFTESAIVFHQHPESLFDYLKTKFYRAYWRVRLYSKHKSKIVKDSYTPATMKLQIPILYFSIFFLAVSIFSNDFRQLAIMLFSLFIILSLPFTIFVLRKDFILGLLAIPLVSLRSIVFGLGLFAGYLKGVDK